MSRIFFEAYFLLDSYKNMIYKTKQKLDSAKILTLKINFAPTYLKAQQYKIGDNAVEEEKANKIGKWMFRILVVVALIYFWWMVIYDHGVPSAHG